LKLKSRGQEKDKKDKPRSTKEYRENRLSNDTYHNSVLYSFMTGFVVTDILLKVALTVRVPD